MATLNTRIQLLRDSQANWENYNPVLRLGEFGFDSTNKYIKVGDGTKHWKDLPNIRLDVTDIDNIESIDTNTTYQLVTDDNLTYTLQYKNIGDSAWTDGASFTLPDLTTLNLSPVRAGTGQVLGMVSQHDGLLSAEIKTLQEADIPELGQDKITDLESDLGTIDATLSALAVEKQDVLGWTTVGGAYNKTTNPAATKGYVDEAVKDIAGAMHFIGTTETELSTGSTVIPRPPYAEGQTPSDGDVVICVAGESTDKEFVWAQAAWHELGKEGVYATKAELAAVAAEVEANATNISTLSVETIPAIDNRLTANEALTNQNKSSIHQLSAVTVPAIDGRLETVEDKLATVEEGAQVNIIEDIVVGNLSATIDSNKVATISFDGIDCGNAESIS